MKINRRNLGLLAVKFMLSGLLLWFVLSRVHTADIISRIRSFDWRVSVLAISLWMLNLVFASWRWSILSLRLLPFAQAFRYTWIGFFFGSVLPGAISGDVAKGVSLGLKDKAQHADRLAASIFLDKLVGFFTLLVFFNLAAGWILFRKPGLFGQLRPVALAGVAGGIACFLGLVLCWRCLGNPHVRSWIDRLPFASVRHYARWTAGAFAPYRQESRAIFAAIALSAVIHSVVILVYWLMFRAAEPEVTVVFAATFYPLLSLILIAPVSISGIGLRDAFTVMMFSAFGLHPEAGVAVSWLMLALNIPIVMVGGLIQIVEFFRRGRTAKP